MRPAVQMPPGMLSFSTQSVLAPARAAEIAAGAAAADQHVVFGVGRQGVEFKGDGFALFPAEQRVEGNRVERVFSAFFREIPARAESVGFGRRGDFIRIGGVGIDRELRRSGGQCAAEAEIAFVGDAQRLRRPGQRAHFEVDPAQFRDGTVGEIVLFFQMHERQGFAAAVAPADGFGAVEVFCGGSADHVQRHGVPAAPGRSRGEHAVGGGVDDRMGGDREEAAAPGEETAPDAAGRVEQWRDRVVLVEVLHARRNQHGVEQLLDAGRVAVPDGDAEPVQAFELFRREVEPGAEFFAEVGVRRDAEDAAVLPAQRRSQMAGGGGAADDEHVGFTNDRDLNLHIVSSNRVVFP